MRPDPQVNLEYCTDKLSVAYAHVGLLDAPTGHIYIARQREDILAVRITHARLLVGGTQDTSTADKDRFVCFWLHTPHTGEGYVQGYPIEWDEGHLLIRLDPNWNHQTRQFIPPTDTPQIEANIERQYLWGKRLYEAYLACKPPYALSWHMIGPRATDSMFYIQRTEAREQR